MPGLQAFGRLWSVASDDFVFPAALELVINCSWLVAVAAIYVTHKPGDTCGQEGTLAAYVLGCGIQLVVSVPLLLLLGRCSSRGTVMDPASRRAVVPLLHCRLALFLFSVGWDIAGTIWLTSDIRRCEVTSPTVQVIKALVICNWLRFVFILIGLAVVFDPLGSVSLSGGGYSSARRKKSLLRRSLWYARCRFLCCCLHTDETSEALRDVAGHIATLVGEADLVPSDVVAGLILLQQKHASQPELPPEPPPQLQPRPFTHERSDWMTAGRATHFMRYALGVYGWPWFVHGRMTSSLRLLWRRVVCCAPYRNKSSLALGDNCCLCNTAALQECTALEDGDFLYVSFVNRLYQVAFLVAVDHAEGSIVIAIRGTLSVIDALTDLCLDSALVDETGRPEDRAHKGMLRAARFILTTLKETEALDRAIMQYPDYTLVITGHSLGAGAAALLGCMLRPAYPRLQCFAFSPPGGLVSRPLSEEMQAYVMSVVCGDDLVPRLSVAAVEKLKQELEDVLTRCPFSKHALLYRACCNCACGASHDLVTPEGSREDSEADSQRPLVDRVDRSNYESLVDVAERAMLADAMAEHVPLYLPGHVLHVATGAGGTRDGASLARPQWRTPEYFCNIRVTGSMFADHLPDLVSNTLCHLATEQTERC